MYIVPEPPTGLKIEAVNKTHVKLSWTPSMSPSDVPVMCYSVSVKENDNLPKSYLVTDTNHLFPSTNGFTYKYTVVAVNVIGNSNVSASSFPLLFDGKEHSS